MHLWKCLYGKDTSEALCVSDLPVFLERRAAGTALPADKRMQKITISEREAGQRLDRYLGKLMPYAPKSFFYKMLRKKNIVLNGKKAEGMEKLAPGDEIKLFLAEETMLKFRQENRLPEKGSVLDAPLPENRQEIAQIQPAFSVVYEDTHILIMNKPAGLLSQKARREDVSLIEHMTAYLLQTKVLSKEELQAFHPGICNRLDRNTSGLVIGGKTTRGLQEMNALLKERVLDKYYLTIVSGQMKQKLRAEGYLKKDKSHNRVSITKEPAEGADPICTEYEPLAWADGFTCLRVKLITGKSHQIRAHLKSLGYPVIGDGKYGDVRVNQEMRRRFSLQHHLLHAYELHFPKLTGILSGLSEQTVYAPLTEEFQKVKNRLFPEEN